MMNRLLRTALSALLVTLLAGSSTAWAQRDKEEDDDESDPCADVANPCGGDDSADDEKSGGDRADDEADGDRGEKTARKGDGGAGGGGAAAIGAGEAGGADVGVEMGPTLPPGKLAFNASFQVGLTTDAAGEPISIAPDVWYGVNAKLSAGAITSNRGQTGFWSGLAGTGLCLSDEASGCSAIFDNLGVEGLYSLKSEGSRSLAVDTGLHALSFDPLLVDFKLGVQGLWRSGKIVFGFAPSVFVALTERGDDGGNFDQIFLPLDLSYAVTSKLNVGVQTGIAGTLQHFGDDYRVPLAFGGFYAVNPKMMVAAAFTLDRVIGGNEGPSATDTRSFSLAVGYTL